MPSNPQQHSSAQRPAEAASKVVERLEKTAEQTASSAVEHVRQARERTQSGIEQQRAQMAERIRRFGGALRSSSESLSAEDPFARHLLEVVSERVERAASYVDQASPGALAEDLQGFARRRPGVFFGGAFLAGLALGRFAKSTAGAGLQSESEDDDWREPERGGQPWREESPEVRAGAHAAAARSSFAAPGASGSSTSPGSGTSSSPTGSVEGRKQEAGQTQEVERGQGSKS